MKPLATISKELEELISELQQHCKYWSNVGSHICSEALYDAWNDLADVQAEVDILANSLDAVEVDKRR